MKLTIAQQAEKQERIADLRKRLKPGKTIYTILRHKSASGMMRVIDLMIIEKGEPRRIGWSAAQVMRMDRYDGKRDGIRVGGCGMDMGFHLVYSLGRVLYPHGFRFAKGQRGRNGDTSGRDNDGGYAFRHEWL